MSAYTAAAAYGPQFAIQPTATPTPDHAGHPEPSMATRPAGGRLESPIVAIVVILGLVVLLTQISFRGSVAVKG